MQTRKLYEKRGIGRAAMVAVIVVIVIIVAGAAVALTLKTTTSSTTTTQSTISTTTSSSQMTTTSSSAMTTTSTSTTAMSASSSGNITVSSDILSLTYADVPNTDPAIGSDEASSAALVNLYDSLVFPTSSGQIVPDLATSWNVSTNDLTYTFNLRSGVTFHNGDPFTSADVVFSMDRFLNMSQGYSYLLTPYVANITAPNSNTVVINLKQTFGPFLSALVRLYILDQAQVVAHEDHTVTTYGSNGDYGSTWLLTHDAGSGPYEMVSANLEANMIIQEYANYWNGTNTNQPREVQLIGIDTPTTVQALFSTHEIQITDQWQTYSLIQALSKLPGSQMVEIPTVNEMYLMMNTQKAPTDDIYVREAMSYALNYSAVIDNIFQGSKPSAGPVPSVLPGHNPNIPVSAQNLTLAKELIQKSKYYSNGKITTPIEYYWVSAVPAEQQLALEFASDMQAIGITVNIVSEPWLTVVADLGNESSSPNIVSVEDGASYYEAGSVLQSRYTLASQGTWEQNEWLNNQTLNSAILSALSIVNQTARFQAYESLQTQIYNMYPTIYAFDVYEVRAYYPSVVNWYAADGHPNALLGYDFIFRDFTFNSTALAALGG